MKLNRPLLSCLLLLTCFYCTIALSQSADSIAHVLANQAETLNNKGSLPLLEEAFTICEDLGCADSTIARLYQRKSVAVYLAQIDNDLSLSYTDSAILFYEKAFGVERLITANSYYNKGVILSSLGRNLEGKSFIETAINKLKSNTELSVPVSDSISLNWNYHLMNINTWLGDFSTALQIGEDILESKYLFPRVELGVTTTSGSIYEALGKHEKSKEVYLSFLQKYGPTSDLLVTSNLGITLLALGEQKAAAEKLFARHKIDSERHERNASNISRIPLSNSHSNLLLLYLQIEDWEQAEYHYKEALRLLLEVDSTGRHPRFAEIYFKKAELEFALSHYENSLGFIAKAMNVVAPQLVETSPNEEITIIGPFKQALEIIAFRAQVLTSQGQYEAALADVMLLNRLVTQSRRTYQSSLSKYYLIQEVMPVYELGIQLNQRLYGQTGDPKYLEQAYALNARNKAILLLESLQSDRAMTFAGLPLEVQGEEKALRDALIEQERLLYSAYQRDQEIDSLQSIVFEREQAYYQFIQQLEKDYPAYYQLKYSADQPPVVNEVQMELDQDQALLEYFIGQDSIYTFAMDGANLQVFSLAKPAGLVDSIELFRELLANGIEDDCETTYIRLGRYFYDLLLATPLHTLAAHKDRLVIIPDGLLNFLSFEALLYKDITSVRSSEGFLLEKYAFSYAYSSKLLLEEDFYPRSATKGFVGFGTEYDDATLEYLKDFVYHEWKEADTTWTLPCGQTKDTTRFWGKLAYSDDEVRAISELTQGASWLNEAVTKENFFQNAEGYNLLHLAMHGTYDLDFPMNSSLIFTKGDSSDVFLRAAEIYGLELDGDMVVLSACNTAYGKLQAGEGPMTLARAFHYAGIPSVVASLWSIPDNSTSRIMKLFYEQLDRGIPKDEALQQAKLQYLASDEISSPTTRQPLNWASTIVIGDIEPVAVSPSNFWWWAGGVLAFVLFGLALRARRA